MTINTIHSRFNVVRLEVYVHKRSMECIFIWMEEEEEDYTLKTSLLSLQEKKSNSRCNRELAAGDLMRVQKTRRAGKAIRKKLKEGSPFSVGRGSLFIGEDPLYESRQSPCE